MDDASNRAMGQVILAGIPLRLVRIGNTLYFKGNRIFAASLSQSIHTHIPGGRWLKVSAQSQQFFQLASFTQKTPELERILDSNAQLSKGQTTMIGGQSSIELKQAGKLYTASLYIAASGKPYPLKLTKTGREHGQSLFSNWDKRLILAPPPKAVELPQG